MRLFLQLLVSYSRFARHMGWKYVLFRTGYELCRLSGLLRLRHPVDAPTPDLPAKLGETVTGKFFITSKEDLPPGFPYTTTQEIETPHIPVGKEWLTHPTTGYCYQLVHWTKISDFLAAAGDVKAVWELSRFVFLIDMIRIDFHQKTDLSERVFASIEDWIVANPVNRGPNWKCGQEISIRLLNWTFALFYYRNTPSLNPARLTRILGSIYHQAVRVSANIRFSQVAVRNNHALTETLLLYLIGTLYPFFPESQRWKQKGKKGFEAEVAYQINPEGAFLQHSMNYHRVAVQLLTWAIQIAEANGDRWSDTLYSRASACFTFLSSFQDPVSGWLPNFGANDGALFFPLSSAHFRDYRPQLTALGCVLKKEQTQPDAPWAEEAFWVRGTAPIRSLTNARTFKKFEPFVVSYPQSGYFAYRTAQNLLFLRCGRFRHRPSQADNLHLDLWENGENLLFDAGTYRYQGDENLNDYCAGTESHNTVVVGHFDQMRRGPRFTWSNWIQHAEAEYRLTETGFFFQGKFTGYFHVRADGIVHTRTVEADKELNQISITDSLAGKPAELRLRQLWHPSDAFLQNFTLSAATLDGASLSKSTLNGWYCERYGVKKRTEYFEFSTLESTIKTIIRRKKKKNEATFDYPKSG